MKFNLLLNAGHRLGTDNGGVAPTGQTEAKTNINVCNYFHGFCVENNMQQNPKVNLICFLNHAMVTTKYLSAYKLRNWASKQEFDISISFHTNDSENEKALGCETLYNPNSQLSKLLAMYIQEELTEGLEPTINRGIKPRSDLAMLKIDKTVCVLVEPFFLTEGDYRRGDTHKEQKEIARRIYKGMMKFIKFEMM